MIRKNISITAIILGFAAVSASGNTVTDSLTVKEPVDLQRLIHVTDSLARNYKFSEAVSLFQEAKASADSLDAIAIDEAMVTVQNGESMTGFCNNPTAVARERFSLNDFFLYYPLKDNSWRPVPNQLDSLGGDPFAKAVYVPSDAENIYWSAKDSDGIRNIYRSEYRDTVWSAPALINEQVTTSSDEIYPMLSPDGK